MQLTIKQRLLLLNILPTEGKDISLLRIVRDLRGCLSFTEAELEEFEIVEVEEGRLAWNKDRPVEIKIGPRAHVLIQDTLKELNENQKLSLDHIDLWDMFDCDET